MSDAVITTLTTQLQSELTAGAATVPSILALSAGLVTQSQTYYNTVQARRVGLLTDINVLGGEDVGKLASKFSECMSSDAFQRSQDAQDSDLGQLKNGIPGLSTSKLNAIATGVMSRATAYQLEFNQTLPS